MYNCKIPPEGYVINNKNFNDFFKKKFSKKRERNNRIYSGRESIISKTVDKLHIDLEPSRPCKNRSLRDLHEDYFKDEQKQMEAWTPMANLPDNFMNRPYREWLDSLRGSPNWDSHIEDTGNMNTPFHKLMNTPANKLR